MFGGENSASHLRHARLLPKVQSDSLFLFLSPINIFFRFIYKTFSSSDLLLWCLWRAKNFNIFYAFLLPKQIGLKLNRESNVAFFCRERESKRVKRKIFLNSTMKIYVFCENSNRLIQ